MRTQRYPERKIVLRERWITSNLTLTSFPHTTLQYTLQLDLAQVSLIVEQPVVQPQKSQPGGFLPGLPVCRWQREVDGSRVRR